MDSDTNFGILKNLKSNFDKIQSCKLSHITNLIRLDVLIEMSEKHLNLHQKIIKTSKYILV